MPLGLILNECTFQQRGSQACGSVWHEPQLVTQEGDSGLKLVTVGAKARASLGTSVECDQVSLREAPNGHWRQAEHSSCKSALLLRVCVHKLPRELGPAL